MQLTGVDSTNNLRQKIFSQIEVQLINQSIPQEFPVLTKNN